jgi:hypothetical protein
MVCCKYFKNSEGVGCRFFSFTEYNLTFFGLAQLFWLLYPKFGRFFPNLLVTLFIRLICKLRKNEEL